MGLSNGALWNGHWHAMQNLWVQSMTDDRCTVTLEWLWHFTCRSAPIFVPQTMNWFQWQCADKLRKGKELLLCVAQNSITVAFGMALWLHRFLHCCDLNWTGFFRKSFSKHCNDAKFLLKEQRKCCCNATHCVQNEFWHFACVSPWSACTKQLILMFQLLLSKCFWKWWWCWMQSGRQRDLLLLWNQCVVSHEFDSGESSLRVKSHHTIQWQQHTSPWWIHSQSGSDNCPITCSVHNQPLTSYHPHKANLHGPHRNGNQSSPLGVFHGTKGLHCCNHCKAKLSPSFHKHNITTATRLAFYFLFHLKL